MERCYGNYSRYSNLVHGINNKAQVKFAEELIAWLYLVCHLILYRFTVVLLGDFLVHCSVSGFMAIRTAWYPIQDSVESMLFDAIGGLYNL